ncbi:MAG: hypothetical protein JO163_06455, partial [Methylobacteriaceae bacterium]|nr:hypothetical protein [Methylobacteriaceae bacterium]
MSESVKKPQVGPADQRSAREGRRRRRRRAGMLATSVLAVLVAGCWASAGASLSGERLPAAAFGEAFVAPASFRSPGEVFLARMAGGTRHARVERIADAEACDSFSDDEEAVQVCREHLQQLARLAEQVAQRTRELALLDEELGERRNAVAGQAELAKQVAASRDALQRL